MIFGGVIESDGGRRGAGLGKSGADVSIPVLEGLVSTYIQDLFQSLYFGQLIYGVFLSLQP